MLTTIRAAIAALPLWVRKALVDFIETGVPTLLALSYAGDTTAFLHAVAIALGAAALSAIRRNLSDAFLWIRGLLGVAADA